MRISSTGAWGVSDQISSRTVRFGCAEYLDEVEEPRLHPGDPILRARNRAWTDFVPDFSPALSGVYYAKTAEETQAALEKAPARLTKLEEAIATEREGDGPYFNGATLSLVDAAYAPFLQRFAFVEAKLATGLLRDFPLLQAWSDALLANKLVTGSVPANFEDEFVANLKRRGFHAGSLFEMAGQAAD